MKSCAIITHAGIAAKSLRVNLSGRVLKATGLNPRKITENSVGRTNKFYSVFAAPEETMTSPDVSNPEAFWKSFMAEQKKLPALSTAEASRTLMSLSRRGVITTIGKQKGIEEFPCAAFANFVVDDEGKPLIVLSTLSPRRAEVEADSRVSLFVVENDDMSMSNQQVSMTGMLKRLEGDDEASAKSFFLSKSPESFWVNFGDMGVFKLDDIKQVRFIVGSGIGNVRIGNVKEEEYLKAAVDPVYQFGPFVCKHMNEDHSESLHKIVKHYVGLDIESAKMIRIDRFGFDMICKNSQLGTVPCRLSFPREATDRPSVKDRIVEMSRESDQAAS